MNLVKTIVETTELIKKSGKKSLKSLPKSGALFGVESCQTWTRQSADKRRI